MTQRKILAISRLATSSTNKSSILNNRFFLNAFAYLVAKNANQYLKFAALRQFQQRANQLFFDRKTIKHD
jgi:hypothetical protein